MESAGEVAEGCLLPSAVGGIKTGASILSKEKEKIKTLQNTTTKLYLLTSNHKFRTLRDILSRLVDSANNLKRNSDSKCKNVPV